MVFTKWFVDENANNEITLTGHSKGGGEAAVNAELWNINAIVFNPSTPDMAYALADDGYVKPFVVKNEILNNIFGEFPLGTTTYLDKKNNSFMFKIPIISGVNNHGMSAVIDSLVLGGY